MKRLLFFIGLSVIAKNSLNATSTETLKEFQEAKKPLGYVGKLCAKNGPFRKGNGAQCKKDIYMAALYPHICYATQDLRTFDSIRKTKCYKNAQSTYQLNLSVNDMKKTLDKTIEFKKNRVSVEEVIGNPDSSKKESFRIICKLANEKYANYIFDDVTAVRRKCMGQPSL